MKAEEILGRQKLDEVIPPFAYEPHSGLNLAPMSSS